MMLMVLWNNKDTGFAYEILSSTKISED